MTVPYMGRPKNFHQSPVHAKFYFFSTTAMTSLNPFVIEDDEYVPGIFEVKKYILFLHLKKLIFCFV